MTRKRLIAELHRLRMPRSMIARITRCSHTYVAIVLREQGCLEHWNDPEHVIASLPDDLRKACETIHAP